MPELGPYLIGLAAMVALLSYVYRLRSLSVEERQAEIRAGLHRARPFAEAWAVRHLPIWLVAVCGLGALGFQGAHFAGYGPGLGGVGTIFGSRSKAGGLSGGCTYVAPNTPTIDAVVFAASGDSVRLLGSAFAGSCGAAHDSTQFHVDTINGNWSALDFSSSLGAVLTDTAPGLDSAGHYKARVRYKDQPGQGGWSAWSDSVAFQMVSGSVYFAMDYSSGAPANNGWTSRSGPGADATVTRMAGIGPSGEDGYRHELDYINDNGGDNYWSWDRDFGNGAPFAYDDTVYVRWRQRWVSGMDCRGLAQGGGGGLAGVWRDKQLSFNEQGGDPNAGERIFFTLECRPAAIGGLDWRYYIAKGGGVDPATTHNGPEEDPWYSVTTNWIDVQVELIYSSGSGVADGCYSIWIDTNTYGSPSAQRCSIQVEQGGEIRFGFYYNNGEYSDGTIGWDHVGFEIDDAFDSSWNN